MFLSAAFYSVSATPSLAKILNGVVSNAITNLMKWVWSLKANTKTMISGRPMMKFESGYSVETVFDGSKLGIEPYSVEIMSGWWLDQPMDTLDMLTENCGRQE